MGTYINPTNMTKEQFLEQFGIPVGNINIIGTPDNIPSFEDLSSSKLDIPVVYVDNGLFSAVAVLLNENEYREFTQKNDKRPRIFFIVAAEDLKPYVK